MVKVRAGVKINGLVQGVFFRSYTRDKALSLKVCGWVRNLPDGRVEAVFEGEEDVVREIIAWCHHGSSSAVVRGVDAEFAPYTGEFGTFKII